MRSDYLAHVRAEHQRLTDHVQQVRSANPGNRLSLEEILAASELRRVLMSSFEQERVDLEEYIAGIRRDPITFLAGTVVLVLHNFEEQNERILILEEQNMAQANQIRILTIRLNGLVRGLEHTNERIDRRVRITRPGPHGDI